MAFGEDANKGLADNPAATDIALFMKVLLEYTLFFICSYYLISAKKMLV